MEDQEPNIDSPDTPVEDKPEDAVQDRKEEIAPIEQEIAPENTNDNINEEARSNYAKFNFRF
jgi:hypothetical protein